jgi:hypothetical protein
MARSASGLTFPKDSEGNLQLNFSVVWVYKMPGLGGSRPQFVGFVSSDDVRSLGPASRGGTPRV